MHFCFILEKRVKWMFRYELKKVFSDRVNRVMLGVAVILAIVFSCFAIGSVRYVDEEGRLHTGIMASRRLAADRNRWGGIMNLEKFVEVVQRRVAIAKKYGEDIPDTEWGKELQAYNDIVQFIVTVSRPDLEYDEGVLYQLTEKEINNLYTTYERNIQAMIAEYGQTSQQKKFLARQYRKVKMPLFYRAKDSWDTMAMYVETYSIVLAVIIGFLASGIFSEEFRAGAEAVFYSTKYGRSKAVKIKIVAGLLMTTIVYLVGVGILTLISFGIMGTSGFHTPYQIDQPYSIYSMTYGQYYLLMVVCGYIASVFAASLTMLVTAKIHTRNIAIGIPFFLYCMMPFIGRALPSFATVFNLMPNVLLNVMQCAKAPIVFQIQNTVFRQIPMVMLIYAILSVLLLPFTCKSFCRYGCR